MKVSVSKKAGLIVSASLFISLSVMTTILLMNESSSKISSTKVQVDDLSQLMGRSIAFSMLNGNSDVKPFIEKMKNINNLSELRITPTDKIVKGSESRMDAGELEALRSGNSMSFEETFKGKPVLRDIEVIKEEQGCISCHDGSVGQPMAVVSIRYSLQAMYSGLAAQRLTAIILGTVAILLTFFIAMHFIKSRIIKGLNVSITGIRNLSEGDVTEIELEDRDDEIGNLNEALKKLQKSMADRSRLCSDFAAGNFEKDVELLSERDELGKSFGTIKQSLMSLIDDLKTLTRSSLDGKLNYRSDGSRHKGEFRRIIEGINSTLDAVIQPVKDSSGVLARMAEKDFTVSVEGEYKGDHQIIKNSINNLRDSLNSIINDIQSAVLATVSASEQISSSTEEMAAGASEQSRQAADVRAAIEQMSNTIMDSARSASMAMEASRYNGEVAKRGGEVVLETVNGMSRISEVVKESADTVKKLGKSSEQIGEIIQVINDIADQTNLLALNAAIEAARAGEQGRGFAVVADEVRKLAERTTKATKEIADMIKQIQKDTEGAVLSMERGTEEVEKGRDLADKAGNSLNEIIEGAGKVADIIVQVAAASEQQSASSEEISMSIESISSVTQQSAAGIQQIAKAAEDLNRLTSNLERLIGKFQVSKGSAGESRSTGAEELYKTEQNDTLISV